MTQYTIYHVTNSQGPGDYWPWNKPVLIEVQRFNQARRVQRWAEQHPNVQVWVREADTYGNVRWYNMSQASAREVNTEHSPWLVAKCFEILDLNKIVCEGARI